MATSIHVIVTIDNLLKTIKPLLIKHEVSVYVNKLDPKSGSYNTTYHEDQLLGTDPTYHQLFFMSNNIEASSVKSFYDDEWCAFCMECTGGRYDNERIEIVELKTVSKKPDHYIKSFFMDIHQLLQEDKNFGIGIVPLDDPINRNTFYHKDDIQNKTVWRDFKNKTFYGSVKATEHTQA